MSRTLISQGPEAALRVLNTRVPHRYSAVYRLHPGGDLTVVLLVDKRSEECPVLLREVPYEDSFCQYALTQGQFRTNDSAVDARLFGHPYKGVVNSYHAAPFIGADGRVKGTMCHLDFAAMVLPDEDFELLRLATRIFPSFLPRW